jgi:hypothetical protein
MIERLRRSLRAAWRAFRLEWTRNTNTAPRYRIIDVRRGMDVLVTNDSAAVHDRWRELHSVPGLELWDGNTRRGRR